MPNTTASLDFQECVRIIRQMQECINNIHNQTGVYVGAYEAALEKSTEQKWMREIVNVGLECKKQCVEVSEGLDSAVAGLRKFDQDMRDFSDSGLGADI